MGGNSASQIKCSLTGTKSTRRYRKFWLSRRKEEKQKKKKMMMEKKKTFSFQTTGLSDKSLATHNLKMQENRTETRPSTIPKDKKKKKRTVASRTTLDGMGWIHPAALVEVSGS